MTRLILGTRPVHQRLFLSTLIHAFSQDCAEISSVGLVSAYHFFAQVHLWYYSSRPGAPSLFLRKVKWLPLTSSTGHMGIITQDSG